MKSRNYINEVSEVFASVLASRPDLVAKMTTQKGATERRAPSKRLSMKDRKAGIREMFYSLSDKSKL